MPSLTALLAAALPAHVASAGVSWDDVAHHPLHPVEESHLSPRAVESRRRDFAAGRAAAHTALATLGSAPGPIGVGPHRQPLWPDGFVGSITHAEGMALAAAARRTDCRGVGIDLEHRGRHFAGLAEGVALPAERDRLHRLPEGPERIGATIELFSAKEAIYKAFFPSVGRYFGFGAVLLAPSSDPGTLIAEFAEPVDAVWVPGRTFPVQVAWVGDLALATVVIPTD